VSDDLEISQGTISFGEYANVQHAKDIISMLMLQSGSTIVEEDNGSYNITINRNPNKSLNPGEATLSFYTQFVSPNKGYYTWNRSKKMDRNEFLAGNLALYFAPGSERKNIERDNPNLNFDTTVVPQGSDATIKRDFGTFYAFAIPRTSKNFQGAYDVALFLSDIQNVNNFTDEYGLAPVLRAGYGEAISEAHKNAVYKSALISHGWLDPNPSESDAIFNSSLFK